MPSYVFTTRGIMRGEFVSEPDAAAQVRYLRVPDDGTITPTAEIESTLWTQEVQQLAVGGASAQLAAGGEKHGAVLVFVHGYNNSTEAVLARHRQLQVDLAAVGWKGVVVSYDWPSASCALNYLEDRADAKATAFALVRGGIRLLAATQRVGCNLAVHLLAHSTGAYVVREAFDHADDNAVLRGQVWGVGQCAFIAADVSGGSLGDSDSSVSIYRHCARLTNYSNGNDEVLQISNLKRFGAAPRAGRVGLPADAPASAVNVDCTAYWRKLDEAQRRLAVGAFCHSWHFGDLGFTKDLAETLHGGLDRAAIPGRQIAGENRFSLA
ncbi:MAG: alpha/beta hydrolase [Verrucomicrobia bacterium]|nr:alpha/beta hydrolase [Verrucomicrobiota bacterium]